MNTKYTGFIELSRKEKKKKKIKTWLNSKPKLKHKKEIVKVGKSGHGETKSIRTNDQSIVIEDVNKKLQKQDYKKVREFLKDLGPVEFRYLELTVDLAKNIQLLITRFGLTKEKFCELFKIKKTQYENYTKGNFLYSITDIAKLNAVSHQLSYEEKEKVSVEIEK